MFDDRILKAYDTERKATAMHELWSSPERFPVAIQLGRELGNPTEASASAYRFDPKKQIELRNRYTTTFDAAVQSKI